MSQIEFEDRETFALFPFLCVEEKIQWKELE